MCTKKFYYENTNDNIHKCKNYFNYRQRKLCLRVCLRYKQSFSTTIGYQTHIDTTFILKVGGLISIHVVEDRTFDL